MTDTDTQARVDIMLDISRAREFRQLLRRTLKSVITDAVNGTETIRNVNDLLVDMLLDLTPKMNTPEQIKAAVVDYVFEHYTQPPVASEL